MANWKASFQACQRPTHLLNINLCIIHSTGVSIHGGSHFLDTQLRHADAIWQITPHSSQLQCKQVRQIPRQSDQNLQFLRWEPPKTTKWLFFRPCAECRTARDTFGCCDQAMSSNRCMECTMRKCQSGAGHCRLTDIGCLSNLGFGGSGSWFRLAKTLGHCAIIKVLDLLT